MPRDYKHQVTRKKKRTRLSPWTGVFAGLLIGLFVAFLVYIKLQSGQREPVYIQETLPPPVAASQDDIRDVRKEGSKVIPAPPKPRFDFYTLLPEMEVVIPEEEITESLKQTPPPPVAKPARDDTPPPQATVKPAVPAKPAPPPKPTPKPAPSDTYYLQVGSFSDSAKADRFRAELAMMGMQTSIQKVTINNRDTYHRVRVGPFGTLNELDRTRKTLKNKGIDSTPIKVRG
ncbi:MAG: SPOR domain-containing protein [Pseudomonadota bacterium]